MLWLWFIFLLSTRKSISSLIVQNVDIFSKNVDIIERLFLGFLKRTYFIFFRNSFFINFLLSLYFYYVRYSTGSSTLLDWVLYTIRLGLSNVTLFSNIVSEPCEFVFICLTPVILC